jgi:hypothetical protein
MGSGGVMGKPDVEKRQLVAELQRFCPAKRKRALRGRNQADGYPGGHIEDERVRERSFSRRPTHRIEEPHVLKIPARRGGILTNGERGLSISG